MGSFFRDLQYTFRNLSKSAGFTLIAIVTLALGMAVNATVFSVINGIMLRPLPVPHAEQLTVLAREQTGVPGLQHFSYPDYEELNGQNSPFSDVFGYHVTLAALVMDGKGDHCILSRVTSNYFSALGIKPAEGRLLLPTEGRTPGADAVVVLGYAYWKRRFGSDVSVIGKQVEIGQHPFTVVGVTPKEFHGTYASLNMDGYVPLSAVASDGDGDEAAKNIQELWTSRGVRDLSLLGRLKPGVSLQEAQASLHVEAKRIADANPKTDKGVDIQLYPEKFARPEPDPQNSLVSVAGAFLVLGALVLLVACFNIANVLLVRATARQREMGIRSALGAGRMRLVRQYLTESLALAVLGGATGLLMTSWATGFLSSLPLGTDLPIDLDFHADGRVLLFAFAVVLVMGTVVGIIPALRAARTDVNSVLREGGRGSSEGPKRHIARNVLVVAQLAGSLMLLIVAGLFIRSLENSEKINLGLNPDHVLNVSVDVQQMGYKDAQGRAFFREVDERIRALPGVVSEAEAFSVPMGYISTSDIVRIEGHPAAPGQPPPASSYNMVTPHYFETMGIPILRGRAFTDSDQEKTTRVAVINQTMAKKFWPNPNEDALGKRFQIKGSEEFVTVVGIAKDGKYLGVTEDPQPFFYLPSEQAYTSIRTIHVRTAGPPEDMAQQIEAQIRMVAPTLPLSQVQTMKQSLQGANGFLFYRLGAQLTGAMGLLGLVLAIVGVYSVVSYATAQRNHEIGIRMAIGAGSGEILRMVLRQSLWVVATGIVVGLGAAFAGTRVLGAFILGVSPSDPLTFGVVVATLSGVALLACWLPARRATKVDPLIALRYE